MSEGSSSPGIEISTIPNSIVDTLNEIDPARMLDTALRNPSIESIKNQIRSEAARIRVRFPLDRFPEHTDEVIHAQLTLAYGPFMLDTNTLVLTEQPASEEQKELNAKTHQQLAHAIYYAGLEEAPEDYL
jgi:hypothetical protein